MKKVFAILGILTAALVLFGAPMMAFAQEVVDGVPALSNEDFFKQMLVLYGSSSGLTGLGLAQAVVQAVMLFTRTPLFDSLFPDFTGGKRLTLFTGLSLVFGVIGSMLGGLEFLPALFASANLTALMVFVNQAYQQATKPAAA